MGLGKPLGAGLGLALGLPEGCMDTVGDWLGANETVGS